MFSRATKATLFAALLLGASLAAAQDDTDGPTTIQDLQTQESQGEEADLQSDLSNDSGRKLLGWKTPGPLIKLRGLVDPGFRFTPEGLQYNWLHYGRRLMFAPHREGGGALHHASQAAAVLGGLGALAGAGTEAYGLATGDKNAEQIGLGEMGLGSVTGVGGGLAAVGTRCHWAMGDHVFKHSRC